MRKRIISSYFSTSSSAFSELDASNTILIKVKVLGGKINGTMLARYLIKITVHSNFMRLKIFRQINGIP